MWKPTLIIASLVAAATPAFAEKSDRVMIDNLRARIDAAYAVNSGPGRVELGEAEARLRDLAKALDNNEEEQARASVNGIEALLTAARIRAEAAEARPASVRPAAPVQLTPPAPVVAKPRTVRRVSHRPGSRRKQCSCLASR
jgi:hypothetical protein